jgi:hypothetical protein
VRIWGTPCRPRRASTSTLQKLYEDGRWEQGNCGIALDFITMRAPGTRIDCGCSTTQAREGLSHELSADCFYESENWGVQECRERRLNLSDAEAERFYRELKERGVSVRVGTEATAYAGWFERLLAELGFELWIGNAVEINRQRVRKQKTHRGQKPSNDPRCCWPRGHMVNQETRSSRALSA